MIKKKVFDHRGGFYFYKLHMLKARNLTSGFPSVSNFLNDVFRNCPDHYFNSGPRSSCLKFSLNLDIRKVSGHEVCSLAELGLRENRDRYAENHMKVQMFMLENDNKTIAMETPIWMENKEVAKFKNFIKSKKPLTGHIDLLRLEDNKLWVWDYKPNANLEKFAPTQVYFYALMLSKRTGIGFEKIRCGYFNTENAFVFKPEEKVRVEMDNNLRSYYNLLKV